MAAHRYWCLRTTAASGGAGWLAVADIQGIEVRAGPNVLTGGTASAPSNYPGFPPSNAFDGNLATSWIETPGSGGQENYPVHLFYDLGAGVTKDIKQIQLTGRNDTANQNPTAFDWQFSDDGISYTTYFSGTWAPSPAGAITTAGILPVVVQAGQLAVIGVEQLAPANIQVGQIVLIAVLEGPPHSVTLGPGFRLPCWQPCTAYGTESIVIRFN